MKTIIFTGGGTTGHVTKNKILIEALRKSHSDLEIHYLGLRTGKEAELITSDLARFHPISSGKLRRYFALETIPDFFRFGAGIVQAWFKLGKLKPTMVFSSGGFVALPVAVAAWMRDIPMITHETDSYPGLANRMIGRMASKVLLGYESAQSHFDSSKTVHVGNPVSPELFQGSKERALKKLGFNSEKKTILVMGGSQGAEQINELVWKILPELLKDYQVVHLTGKGKGEIASQAPNDKQYRPFQYVTVDYADFLTLADIVISRAGGNSLAEIEALGKPAILMPLPLPAAAGDHQRKNAMEMQRKHPDWIVLDSKNVTGKDLQEAVNKIVSSSAGDVRRGDANERVLEILLGYL